MRGFEVKYFTLEGRLNRQPYALILIPVNLGAALITALWVAAYNQDRYYDDSGDIGIQLFMGVITLVFLSPVIVRRLHDLDRPSEHFWLALVPLYNIYLGLVLLFQKGTTGLNRFGDDPLAAMASPTLRRQEEPASQSRSNPSDTVSARPAGDSAIAPPGEGSPSAATESTPKANPAPAVAAAGESDAREAVSRALRFHAIKERLLGESLIDYDEFRQALEYLKESGEPSLTASILTRFDREGGEVSLAHVRSDVDKYLSHFPVDVIAPSLVPLLNKISVSAAVAAWQLNQSSWMPLQECEAMLASGHTVIRRRALLLLNVEPVNAAQLDVGQLKSIAAKLSDVFPKEPAPDRVDEQGRWICECGRLNKASNRYCYHCHSDWRLLQDGDPDPAEVAKRLGIIATALESLDRR